MANEKEVNRGPVRVEITGVSIGFFELMMLIIKFIIAAIPAALIVGMVGLFLSLMLTALFGGGTSY
jgi:hypothetical protein